MKNNSSFLTPNNYICFFTALFTGIAFYVLLYLGYQYFGLAVDRLLGPFEANPYAVFIYVFLYVLFFWGLITIFYKRFLVNAERSAIATLEKSFDSNRIISQRSEVDALRGRIMHGSNSPKVRDSALGQTLLFLIDHCLITESSNRVIEIFSKRLDTLEKHIESSYNILRYIAWAIPTLGFIGTVLGIGSALASAGMATHDIMAVTEPLGTAFDTTLIALVESMFIMFFFYQMQKKEEDLLNSIDLFCQEKYIINLQLGDAV